MCHRERILILLNLLGIRKTNGAKWSEKMVDYFPAWNSAREEGHMKTLKTLIQKFLDFVRCMGDSNLK
jgi:hypothetical protein